MLVRVIEHFRTTENQDGNRQAHRTRTSSDESDKEEDGDLRFHTGIIILAKPCGSRVRPPGWRVLPRGFPMKGSEGRKAN